MPLVDFWKRESVPWWSSRRASSPEVDFKEDVETPSRHSTIKNYPLEKKIKLIILVRVVIACIVAKKNHIHACMHTHTLKKKKESISEHSFPKG